MKFRIEQIALAPRNPARAKALLADLGITNWINDVVVAEGKVHGIPATNVAELSFNYDAIIGNELEILHYTSGLNWFEGVAGVSHFGMHCTEEELAEFHEIFTRNGVVIAQEVRTVSHTNPAIKDTRRYHYVIYDTLEILGVDLKFIVRHEL